MNKTRLRISTLMLLIVILALGMALGIREWRAAHREAELQRGAAGREAELRARIAELEQDDATRWLKMHDHRIQRMGLKIQPTTDANTPNTPRYPFPPAK
jgi:hypothetical protein